MDLLSVLKQLGVGVFLEWGQERGELEDRIGQQRTKYTVILGISIAMDIAVYVIGSWHILPDPLPFIALLLAVSVTAIATIFGLRLQEHFGALRRISDDFLNGKIPVAVASWTLGTLPGEVIALLYEGGSDPHLWYLIMTETEMRQSLGAYFGHQTEKYVLVAHREPSYMETAQALDNLLPMEVFEWLAHRVGGKVLFLPLKFWEKLEQLERDEATRAAVAQS